ncbi:MAG: hypothetical protein EBX57_10800 [Betaproteobacteria bacterium]|nr:hypothetical protein [Betaproteobacteria bacterium]
MLYRENGQFKTSYQADQQIFPIAQDHHRKRFKRNLRERKLHAQFAAPNDAGNQGNKTGYAPDNHPDAPKRNADRLRGLMIVSDSA